MKQTSSPIAECIQHYLHYCETGKRLSTDTLKAYSIDLRQFLKFVEENKEMERIQQVTRVTIQEYLSSMNLTYAVKSVKRKIASLQGLFLFLEEECLIEENPFLKLHFKLKEPFTLPNVLSLREIKRVLSCAYKDGDSLSEFLHHRDIAVLEMLFATGLRVHELCNLTVKDLNTIHSSIRVVGKGRKERHIYIGNQEVLAALNQYLREIRKKGFKSEFLFLNRQGNKMSTQAARNIVTKYTQLAKIKRKITPHAFRHTFATLLLEEGVDIKYIQEFLGHSSISTTQIYLHVSARSCRNILNKKHPRQKMTFSGMA